MNARTFDSKDERSSPAEMRMELGRIELALERARASSNASSVQGVLDALTRERDLLRERLRRSVHR
ncbi:MAG TPA: hypothetical protein PKZ76_07350 [Xanthomonadaceae bacterium]|nr:hypothetical protein [Xanthomonadaceae bacterium]